jgi:hypothetical protein
VAAATLPRPRVFGCANISLARLRVNSHCARHDGHEQGTGQRQPTAVAATRPRPPSFGRVDISLALAGLRVNRWFPLSSERLPVPLSTWGLYGPFCTVTVSPSRSPMVRSVRSRIVSCSESNAE